jgi:hypothetical protein
MIGHVGFTGAPWLINVALAKLGLLAAGGLLTGGAVAGRIARRREQRLLEGRQAQDFSIPLRPK